MGTAALSLELRKRRELLSHSANVGGEVTVVLLFSKPQIQSDKFSQQSPYLPDRHHRADTHPEPVGLFPCSTC